MRKVITQAEMIKKGRLASSYAKVRELHSMWVLHNEGLSLRDIAREQGKSQEWVRLQLKKYETL